MPESQTFSFRKHLTTRSSNKVVYISYNLILPRFRERMKIVNLRTSENRSPGVVPKFHQIFEGLVKLRPITLFFPSLSGKTEGNSCFT